MIWPLEKHTWEVWVAPQQESWARSLMPADRYRIRPSVWCFTSTQWLDSNSGISCVCEGRPPAWTNTTEKTVARRKKNTPGGINLLQLLHQSVSHMSQTDFQQIHTWILHILFNILSKRLIMQTPGCTFPSYSHETLHQYSFTFDPSCWRWLLRLTGRNFPQCPKNSHFLHSLICTAWVQDTTINHCFIKLL